MNRYTTGDHIALFPHNPMFLVEQIAKRLNLNLDQHFMLTPSPPGVPTIPNPCSLRTFLSQYCDLQAPPSRSLLALCAKYTSNPKERQFLDSLHPSTPEAKVTKYDHFVGVFF